MVGVWQSYKYVYPDGPGNQGLSLGAVGVYSYDINLGESDMGETR